MGSQQLYNRLKPEPIRFLAAASIPESSADPAWVKLETAGGVAGLSNPSRVLMIQNLTDQLVSFSWDGSVDATTGVSGNINYQLPSNGFLVLDESTNGTPQGAAFTATGTTFWAQYPSTGTAPTTGTVNVSTIYGTGPTI